MGILDGFRIYKSRGFAVLAAFFLLMYPFAEARMLSLDVRVLESHGLPLAWDGLRIAFVSDVHWGQGYSDQQVEALCRALNGLDADLILLGGDYSGDSQGAVDFFEGMPSLTARLGIAAVPGNHDRTLPESNLARLEDAMRRAGVQPLVNACLDLGQGLVLCGVDDLHTGHPDFGKVGTLCEDASYVILLCHSPAGLPEALSMGLFDLILCGHTHGNPLGGWPRHRQVPAAFSRGWVKADESWILTSHGVGASPLPIRINATPQIHLITLRCGPSE